MTASRDDQVIIVGGGIGGLALAAALQRIGIASAVFERASELQEVGAGLTLWSNAIRALRILGLDEQAIQSGSILERVFTRAPDGELLSEMDFGGWSRRAGAPSVCIHRADLQSILSRALAPRQLHLGAACVDLQQDDDGLTVRFADGQEERGAVLVGADGIHSVVRQQLFGSEPQRYAGYFTYRGIAHGHPDDLPEGTVVFGLGAGAQVGMQHCGRGRIYWFATRNAPPGTAAGLAGDKPRALAAFGGWFPLAPAMIEATEDSALLCNDIIDRPPRWPWGQGRVTLLGDAIHPTTPNLGQGACQALESAVTLAALLRERGVNTGTLRAYEQQRRRWTAMVTRQSKALGNMFQWQNPLAVWARRQALRMGIRKRHIERLFESLLSHKLPELLGEPAIRSAAE